METTEIWKDVEGYEGLYKISNYGNVTKQNGSLMAICNNGTGYRVVYLCKNGKRKTRLVHRLVAEAFIPNHKSHKEINHKDENKENNHVSNLEWCSRSYNASYGTKIERTLANENFRRSRQRAGSHPKPMFRKRVKQIDNKNNVVKVWDSAISVEREIGYDRSAIGKCCRGVIHMAYGYIWKYA